MSLPDDSKAAFLRKRTIEQRSRRRSASRIAAAQSPEYLIVKPTVAMTIL
jgi:hypothetical protein